MSTIHKITYSIITANCYYSCVYRESMEDFMKFDIPRALFIIFNSENWLPKIGMGLAFIAMQSYLMASDPKNIAFSLISLLLISIAYGYVNLSVKEELNGKEGFLPQWDFEQSFMSSLKGWGIGVCYAAPIALVIVGVAMTGNILLKIALALLALPVLIYISIFFHIGCYTFLKDFSFASAFEFSRIYKIFKAGFWDIVIGILISLGVGLGIGVGFGILLGIITIPLKFIYKLPAADIKIVTAVLSSAIQYLLVFTTYNINAQAYNIAVSKTEQDSAF